MISKQYAYNIIMIVCVFILKEDYLEHDRIIGGEFGT